VFFDDQKIKSLQLFDAQGKLILSKEIYLDSENFIDLKLLNITNGLYFISLRKTNGNKVFKKIIYSE
jgi:hypothetical protein